MLAATIGVAAAVFLLWTRPALERASRLDAARRLLAARDDAAAIPLLEAVLDRHPGHGEAALMLARAARRTGDLPRAARMIAVARDGGALAELADVEAALVRLRGQPADGLPGSGFQSDEGRALLVAATTGHPEAAAIFEALVDAAIGSFAMTEAHGIATRWMEAFPDDWLPRVRRGDIRARFSLGELAREDYEAALAIRPDAAVAHAGLGKLLVRQLGRADAAVDHLVQALRREPADIACLTALAEAQLRTATPADARATLGRALELEPREPTALRLEGVLDLEEGHAERAVTTLRRADAAAPGDLETVAALARALALAGRTEEARVTHARLAALRREAESLEPLLRRVLEDATNPDVRVDIGLTLVRMERPADARHWLASALALAPDHAEAAAALVALPGPPPVDRPR